MPPKRRLDKLLSDIDKNLGSRKHLQVNAASDAFEGQGSDPPSPKQQDVQGSHPLVPKHQDAPSQPQEPPQSPPLQVQVLKKQQLDHEAFERLREFDRPVELVDHDNIRLTIERTKFKRQKKFCMEDHQYTISIEQREDKPVLLFDMLEYFHRSLTTIIRGKLNSFFFILLK